MKSTAALRIFFCFCFFIEFEANQLQVLNEFPFSDKIMIKSKSSLSMSH